MTGELSGRVALVTGAGQGIGAAVARRLAAAGAPVAVTDTNLPKAEQAAIDIVAEGGVAAAFALDVTDTVEIGETLDAVEARLGPIEILVNVAGLFVAAPAVDMAAADWDRAFAVNARGVFLVSQAVARRMLARPAVDGRRGAIVTVASQSGKVLRTGQAAYGASKAAASYATKCLGLELAGAGIRCNVVHPGVTETPLALAEWAAGRGSKQAHIDGSLARFRVPIPLGKVASCDEVAEAVLFLASDRASHITMTELVVDGGATLIA